MRIFLFGGWLVFLGLVLSTGSGVADEIRDEGARLGKTCAGCHGTAGASPGRLIPIIGGQVAPFVEKAMLGYRAGSRPGSVMRNIAKGYDEPGIRAMAVWFAAQPWVKTPHAATEGADAALSGGCQGCHGATGEGRAMFPRLAGQAPEYLLVALREYRDGTRAAPMMKLVGDYADADLEKLARYYSALPWKGGWR